MPLLNLSPVYAFNKAHAFSYALIAYQTAYLKANYPVEYITALLSAHAGVTEKITSANQRVPAAWASKVLPPNIKSISPRPISLLKRTEKR